MGAGGLKRARPVAEVNILCAAWADSKTDLDRGVKEENEVFRGGRLPAASILSSGGAWFSPEAALGFEKGAAARVE
jgi:hypothetical protein